MLVGIILSRLDSDLTHAHTHTHTYIHMYMTHILETDINIC